MKTLYIMLCTLLIISMPSLANYERNKAVPVQQVLFGKVQTVRNITEQELVQDKKSGWTTFGGALIGGAIGNQFGGGSGRTVATILGSIIGGNIANQNQQKSDYKQTYLVELLLTVDNGDQYVVVQDFDESMPFHQGDQVRLIYLSNNTVRVDKAY
jgi:outer membrane lipoprotein SlyB